MLENIAFILIIAYLMVFSLLWLYCLYYMIHEFIRGGSNEDF